MFMYGVLHAVWLTAPPNKKPAVRMAAWVNKITDYAYTFFPNAHRLQQCGAPFVSRALPTSLNIVMVPRMAMLRKVLLPAAAIVVSCSVVFLHSPRAAAADDEIRAQYSSLRSTVSSVSGADQNLHHHHALSIEGPEEGKGYRRGLMTFGVPSEGLLLAVANSDEDEIDGLGHEDAATEDFTHWHKRLLPLNA